MRAEERVIMDTTKAKPIKKHTFEKSQDGNSGMFTTGTGAVLMCKRVSVLQISSLEESCAEQWRTTRGKEPPTPPTYTASNGAEYAHDADSIKENPEQQKDWELYLGEAAAYSNLVNAKSFDVFIALGVEIEQERDGWAKEVKGIGLTIPREKNKRKLFYVKSNLTTTEEGIALLAVLRELAGLGEGLLSKVEAMFQHPLGDTERADASAG